ncbi:MAG: phage holin family protein, partial [Bradymonadaceae bacterium]
MVRLLLQILINALAIWAASEIVPGVVFASNWWVAFLWVGTVFGIVNYLLRPLLTILGLP